MELINLLEKKLQLEYTHTILVIKIGTDGYMITQTVKIVQGQ